LRASGFGEWTRREKAAGDLGKTLVLTPGERAT
jgi:hypothetical protein